MHKKENAPTAQGNESATNNRANFTLSPRETRALTALAQAKDWVARETIDRIACCSNGPAVVQSLRHKLGKYDAIEMQRVPVTDADGKTALAGRYRLSETDRPRAVALLRSSHIS